MPQTFKFDSEDFVFVDAFIAAPGDYLFIAHEAATVNDGVHVTHLLRHQQGSWADLASWRWQSVAMAVPSLAPLRVEVAGRDGQVGVFDGAGASTENLEPGRAIGPIRGMGVNFGRVLAYGMQRHVYLRDAAGRWIRFNDGMGIAPKQPGESFTAYRKRTMNADGGINSVIAAGPDGLFAFGMRGEIWQFGGEAWRRATSPTNVMLQASALAPDGDIYVCGQASTLLKGRDDHWKQVPFNGPTGLNFCAIASFAGKVFIADGNSLRTLDGPDLKLVDFGIGDVVPCMQVVANAGEIMSVAGQEVWVSKDGVAWTTLVG